MNQGNKLDYNYTFGGSSPTASYSNGYIRGHQEENKTQWSGSDLGVR